MLVQDYFIKEKVAIRFDTELERDHIHECFESSCDTRIKQGLVSFTQTKHPLGIMMYTISSINVLHMFHDHIILSYEEFRELADESKSIIDGN